MELGEVFKKDGEKSLEKLFYYHFRKICNSNGFRGVEGNDIIDAIQKEHPENVKEIFNSRLFDNETEKYYDIEKILILFSEEVFVSNANNLDYFYGVKRLHSDEELQRLALEYKN